MAAAGTILHYNGTAWSPMTSGTTATLRGVWGSSASDVFAVGSSGTVLHYDGNGWSKMTLPSGFSLVLESVWGSSANDVFVVGTAGSILRYDGNAWSYFSSVTTANLVRVWGRSASDVFVLGGGIGILLHYDGIGWEPARADLREIGGAYCRGMWGMGGTQTGEVLVVGESELVLRNCPNGVCPGAAPPLPASDGGTAKPDASLPKPDTQQPGPACANAKCELGESCDGRSGTISCPADCPGLTTGNPSKQYCCVNGVCIGGGCPVPGCI